MELDKAYDSKQYETDIYKKWLKEKVFCADVSSEKPAYTIMLPPPNATGTLHLGHSMMIALEDIMIRFRKMQGYETLWMPGTDHAGIATQSRVEKKIQESGIKDPRQELGREKLLEEIVSFVEDSKKTIRKQMQSMGASLDWDKEAYTFDPEINKVVNEVFKRMYNDGLIYQGNRIVNWDPNMKTTVADDEIEHKEQIGKLYYLQYGPLIVATSRPETKLGDTAVAVNPNDERWKKYIGTTIEVDFGGKHTISVPVIASESVEIDFGSGALGVTPCHSLADFEIAKKHDLSSPQVVNFQGNMTDIAGEYSGMNLFECRNQLVKDMENKGQIVKIEEYNQSVAVNYRGKGVIEPQVMKQWFIDVNKKVVDWKGENMSVKEVMLDVVRSSMINIIPERFNKTYFNWIENLRDWCVSRQIWWGHQIPMWYKVSDDDFKKINENGISSSYDFQGFGIEIEEMICSEEKPKKNGNWVQDPDCLDTWFSSGLWTFTSLGWPHSTDLLDKFHPTDVLETGYDIIFFWVARMILMTTYVMRTENLPEEKCIPFKNVYLHGLVLDRNGEKMSKSKPETCIDPLDMIEKYGADALRLSLIIGATPGNNIRLYEEKIAGYKNFINKVWNIARFVLKITDEKNVEKLEVKTLADKWILTKLQNVIKKSTLGIESYNFSEVGELIYQFLRDDFADWYVEVAKYEGNKDVILRYVLGESLKLLHPFIPYITEVLWGKGKFGNGMLVKASWSKENENYNYPNIEKEFSVIQEIITEIRRNRSEFQIPTNEILNVYFEKSVSYLENYYDLISHFTKVQIVEKQKDNMVASTVHGIVFWINTAEYIDVEKEKEKLLKELEMRKKQLNGIQRKLQNEKFIKNAKKEIIEKEKEKELSFIKRVEVLTSKIEML